MPHSTQRRFLKKFQCWFFCCFRFKTPSWLEHPWPEVYFWKVKVIVYFVWLPCFFIFFFRKLVDVVDFIATEPGGPPWWTSIFWAANQPQGRVMIWSVILLLSCFLQYLERGSKGMSRYECEKSFSKKLIQLSYDPWMTSMLSGASYGSTHATGALRHVVWLSDVLLAQLTISWNKNTWSDLEIGVDCTDTFSTWHFPPNGEPQKLDGVFSNSTIKDICFGKNWMTFSEKTHGTSLVDPCQAGHGGHVGIARRSPSSLGQLAMWWCHVLSSIVRRRETKSHTGCLI